MHKQHTINWIKSLVIGLNFCPFAQHEMDQNGVRIKVSSATTVEDGIKDFIKELDHLNSTPTTGTTLLLFPYFLSDFFDYLDFLNIANETLVQIKNQDIYQLASFHPSYQFRGTNKEDVSNYTNRSPYPMLHILREEMLDRAISYYGSTEKIPKNNIKCLKKLGIAEVKRRLNACNFSK